MSAAPLKEPPIKKWSFSLLQRFEKCPYEVYLDRVERVKKPEFDKDDMTHPLVRGDRIHKLAEAFIKGETQVIDPLLKKVEPKLRRYQQRYTEAAVEVEQEWGFNENWEPRNWNDPDNWAMVKCDVVEHTEPKLLDVDDWKSGKSHGKEISHGQQMQIYAISGFMRFPSIDIVRTTLTYTDEGKSRSKIYTRPQVLELLPRLTARIKRMTSAIIFPPKPCKLNCRYCSYSPNKEGNGACPYGVVCD